MTISNGDFEEVEESRGNAYRDGKVHVMEEECENCLFHPKDRLVSAAGVKQIVASTKDEPGATFSCHLGTIHGDDAICRGWFDGFGNRDPIMQLAVAMDVIEYVPRDHYPSK